jgi:hypothetical protein
LAPGFDLSLTFVEQLLQSWLEQVVVELSGRFDEVLAARFLKLQACKKIALSTGRSNQAI